MSWLEFRWGKMDHSTAVKIIISQQTAQIYSKLVIFQEIRNLSKSIIKKENKVLKIEMRRNKSHKQLADKEINVKD